CAPSAISARAIARPMPLDPPVTNAIFPFNDSMEARCQYNNAPMFRVAIIGAGELGGLVAYGLACRDLASEIHLIDESRPVASGKALDIMQAAPLGPFAARVSGSTDVTTVAGCDVAILADRAAGGGREGGGRL